MPGREAEVDLFWKDSIAGTGHSHGTGPFSTDAATGPPLGMAYF